MELAFSVLNSLGLFGLAIFLWFIWNGLKDRIKSLRELAEEQGRTLAAVRERAEEFDRLSQRYKQALADFDEMGIKTEARRKRLVEELEEAVRRKDGEIVELKKAELVKVEKEQLSLAKIPEIAGQIEGLRIELGRQAAMITELDPLSSFNTLSGKMAGAPQSLGFPDLVTRAFAEPKATDEIEYLAHQVAEHMAKYAPTKQPPEAIRVTGEKGD